MKLPTVIMTGSGSPIGSTVGVTDGVGIEMVSPFSSLSLLLHPVSDDRNTIAVTGIPMHNTLIFSSDAGVLTTEETCFTIYSTDFKMTGYWGTLNHVI